MLWFLTFARRRASRTRAYYDFLRCLVALFTIRLRLHYLFIFALVDFSLLHLVLLIKVFRLGLNKRILRLAKPSRERIISINEVRPLVRCRRQAENDPVVLTKYVLNLKVWLSYGLNFLDFMDVSFEDVFGLEVFDDLLVALQVRLHVQEHLDHVKGLE